MLVMLCLAASPTPEAAPVHPPGAPTPVVMVDEAEPLSPDASENSETFCDRIIEYMQRVDRAAWWIEDREERHRRYYAALRDLVIAARRHFGPFCPCDELMKRADAYQTHRETYRSPPPGWTPAASKENLMMFSDIAQLDLAVHRGLTAFCEPPR